MRPNFFPIMIGAKDKPDKCSVIAKDEKYGGYSLLVCRLKKGAVYEYGEVTKADDIGKVLCHIHFCKIEAAKTMLKALACLIYEWERDKLNDT